VVCYQVIKHDSDNVAEFSFQCCPAVLTSSSFPRSSPCFILAGNDVVAAVRYLAALARLLSLLLGPALLLQLSSLFGPALLLQLSSLSPAGVTTTAGVVVRAGVTTATVVVVGAGVTTKTVVVVAGRRYYYNCRRCRVAVAECTTSCR